MLITKPQCPVCNSDLNETNESYDIDELFRLWKPVEFSQSTIEEHRHISNSTRLYCCPKCGLETFIPQIIGTPAFYIEAYNLAGTQKDSEFTYSENKWDFQEAELDAQGRSRIFEFGCGTGNFLARIRETASEVAGLEYNSAAVATAREKGLQVYSPDEGPDAYGNHWDAAFSFHVLEHVENPVLFVQAMAAAVKSDGVIGISVPNQNGPISYIRPCIMNLPPHHATRWRLSTFEALAKRLNLSINKVSYEPLLLENHSYYSIYWVQQRIPGSSFLATAVRFGLSAILRIFFGTLRWLGFEYFPLLKGQSIYVSMSHRA